MFMSDMLSRLQFLLPKERKRRMQKGAEGSNPVLSNQRKSIVVVLVLYFRLNFSKQEIHN